MRHSFRAQRALVFCWQPEQITKIANANDIDNISQNPREAFCVVHTVDVLDIRLLVLRGFRIADVINVEAQGLCQVIEPVELEFAFHR